MSRSVQNAFPVTRDSEFVARSVLWKSFTLIELLVVVAIISILASLLLPSLKKARDQAKQITCLAHLKQVSVGLLMLADDNDGYIDEGHTGTNQWWYAVQPYLGGKDDLVKAVSLPAGSGAGGSKGCPTFRPSGWGYTPYGSNAALIYTNWPHASMPRSLREVIKPSITHLVEDCYSSSAWSPSMWDWTGVGANLDLTPSSIYPRHEGRGLNFIFVDGHGAFLKSADWLRQSSNPAVQPTAVYYRWCTYGPFEVYGVDNEAP